MKKISIKRNKILSKAQALILRRGYSAMTIDDICASAEVTKGSFFHYFVSKEALGEAVLYQFWDEVQTRQEKAGYKDVEDPISKLIGYIDHTIETYENPALRSGCLLAIYVLELRETNPLIYMKTLAHINLWRDSIRSMFDNIQNSTQDTSGVFDPLEWTDLYISTLTGALIMAQSLDDVTLLRRSLTRYKKSFLSCFVN